MTDRAPAGVDIVDLDEVPEQDVLALLDRSLGTAAVERSHELWEWKHRHNPFGRSPGLAAVVGGVPVALRVFLRWRWRSGEQIVPAARAVDTATDRDWRRRGLFRRLTLDLVERVRADGTRFVFNTPNRRSGAGYRSMGWQDVGRMPLMVRVRRPLGMARRVLRGRRREAPPSAPALHSLRPLSALLAEDDLPAFLAGWAADEERLHTPRNIDYLAWRYARCPGVGYAASWRFAGDRGALLVVRARHRAGAAELSLVECLASGDAIGREALGELLAELTEAAGADYHLAVAARGTAERRVLLRSGFLPARPAGPPLMVRAIAAGVSPPALLRPAAWRLSAGDLELY